MNLQLKNNKYFCERACVYLKLLNKICNIFLLVEVFFRWFLFLNLTKVVWC